MCIYCGTKRYRKIFEQHFGKIPKDETGKSFDIHHIDGNRNNNSPNNLISLSRQDHYNLHYQQGDFRACQLLAIRLDKTSDEISEIAKLAALKLISENRHNFQKQINPFLKRPDGSSVTSDRTKAGLNSGLNHSRVDKTVYKYINIYSGITEETTSYELRKKYNINKGSYFSMVKGKRKSAGGWKLL